MHPLAPSPPVLHQVPKTKLGNRQVGVQGIRETERLRRRVLVPSLTQTMQIPPHALRVRISHQCVDVSTVHFGDRRYGRRPPGGQRCRASPLRSAATASGGVERPARPQHDPSRRQPPHGTLRTRRTAAAHDRGRRGARASMHGLCLQAHALRRNHRGVHATGRSAVAASPGARLGMSRASTPPSPSNSCA